MGLQISPALPRTVYILDHADQVGGAEVFLFEVLDRIDRTVLRPIVILTGPGDLYERLRSRGHEVMVLPLTTRLTRLGKHQGAMQALGAAFAIPSLLAMVLRLRRLFRSNPSCIVYTFSIKADVYGSIAARLSRTPCVWHMHDLMSREMFPAVYRTALTWIASRWATAVLCNSWATRQAMIQAGLRASTASVIHYGVDTDAGADHATAHNARLALGLGKGPIVGMVGRIAPWKGQHVLVEAAPRIIRSFPGVQLLLVGKAAFGKIDTDYEAQLRWRIRELGLERHVIMTGYRDDVKAIMACCDVLVHASVKPEAYGLVVVEAMALGKPVVAARSGGVPELVTDGQTGMLVQPGDVNGLAQAILYLLQHPDEAHAMGGAAKATVREKLTIQASVAAITRALLQTSAPAPTC
ncbi:MAG: glycosyltransferase family 4 protein [Chloroflexi bacterium]|nr:glycosyltransferase family 4 protein [Chloroflexota bacterium]